MVFFESLLVQMNCFNNGLHKKLFDTLKNIFVLHSDSVGCQGRFLFQDEPKSRWEEAVDQFWNHVSELTSKAEEMRDNIKATQLGRELEWVNAKNIAAKQIFEKLNL